MTVRNVYLDFETYYDNDFTLKHLSIEAYVRDPRFAVQLLGVAVDNGPIEMIDPPDIRDYLINLQLDHPATMTFIQNARFDATIIEMYYNLRVLNPICTRAMARWYGLSRFSRESLAAMAEVFGLGNKGTFINNMCGKHSSDLTPTELAQYKAYCSEDVRILRGIVQHLLPHMTTDALEFIIMSEKMYTQPVFVLDKPLLDEYYVQLCKAQDEAREHLAKLFKFNTTEEFLKAIRSKKSFCNMLESLGGTVPLKLSEKKTARLRSVTGDNTIEVMEPSIAKSDPAFMELQKHPDENIALLCRMRAENNSSIEMSRCQTFRNIATRGTLPVALNVFGAHTGRYTAGGSEGSASDSTNLQNISKRGSNLILRKAITAPDGWSFVIYDASQIEARVLAWLACQNDLLEVFKTGADPYCRSAAAAYNEPYETIHYWTKGEGAHDENADPELKKKYKTYRNIGKTMTLQLGYYSGGAKLALYLTQQGVALKDTPEEHLEEAVRLVRVYRNSNPAIVQFWRTCNKALDALLRGDCGTFGGPEGKTLRYGMREVAGRSVPSIILPDGFPILYPGLRREFDENFGKYVYCYDAMDKGRKVRHILHSGIVCNNCIAEGTLVLTDGGVKPIESITLTDKIWDGVDFVKHSGVICNGTQTCIEVNGVWMTPDHRVLQHNTWRTAYETTRPDRADIRETNCSRVRLSRQEKDNMESPLRVWGRRISSWFGDNQSDKATAYRDVQKMSDSLCDYLYDKARHGTASFFYCVEKYGTALYQKMASCVGSIRRSWYLCLRALVGLRELQTRYDEYVGARVCVRPYRQRRTVLSGEYPLDYVQTEWSESSRSIFRDRYSRVIQANRDITIHDTVSYPTRLASRQINDTTCIQQHQIEVGKQTSVQTKVYDIMNCGPRQRFVVLGDYPFIVHNCTQALAFAMIRYCGVLINRRYKVVANVHDSYTVLCQDHEVEDASRYVEKCMSTPPIWAQGFPLACEGDVCKDFTKG